MSVNLTKGQTVSLTKSDGGSLTQVRMGLGWDAIKVKGLFGRAKEKAVDLDASALLYDASGVLVDQVWFSQLTSKDGAVQHTGDNRTGAGDGDDESIRVALTAVNPAVHTLVFVVNSYTGETFSSIENAFCRLIDETTGQEVARYDLSGSGPHTAQIMAKVSRVGSGWAMTALGVRANGRTIKDMSAAVTQVL
ncbi:TerD family protein [Cellulomonas fimi]|uniref:Stress protein n=1 Tax=Cellulomonas fimi (strain ATCC 484 / DSM 20113 / JCM 1341 / CCUG 24087 / LMG 16345 / NBRC 15513 / NCIMB 8980 / NCTC 7547 / NRS-133) TaxID=590998 RepID=F4H5M7_CELFA|nr:TerD family protein [Cellulomonas fimi]AEE44351.1 stress protein [Cellulomonas fimi ATCC 484]NNH08124.1 TerD family protein [Cellulomonas fimi]VEH26181.1 General stress protein 16U [Cellulomonas fimi]